MPNQDMATVLLRMAALEAHMSQLMTEMERIPDPDFKGKPDVSYTGPLAVGIKTGGQALLIRHGYLYAGEYAEWSFTPDPMEYTGFSYVSGSLVTVNVADADGIFLLFIDVTVDPDTGYFTADYHPKFKHCLKSNYATMTSTPASCPFIVAEFEVSANKITRVVQRWQGGDIYVPVEQSTSTDWDWSNPSLPDACEQYNSYPIYRATWANHDRVGPYRPMASWLQFDGSGLCTSHIGSQIPVFAAWYYASNPTMPTEINS